jgi:hypothetical protein
MTLHGDRFPEKLSPPLPDESSEGQQGLKWTGGTDDS